MRLTRPVIMLAMVMCLFFHASASAQIIADAIFLDSFAGGGGSRAFGINENAGFPTYVCGDSRDAMGTWRPVVWSNGGVGGWVLELLPVTVPGKPGRAWGVHVSPMGDTRACGFAYDGYDRLVPVRWDKIGASWIATPLATLAANTGEALSIFGDPDFDFLCVGYSQLLYPPPAGAASSSATMAVHTATAWRNLPAPNDLTVLPDYGPEHESMANDVDYDAVNQRLYATGFAENMTGNRMAQVWISANAGSLWTRVELPAPPGGAAWSLGSDAGCGNNRVWVIGRAEVAGVEHPIMWESLDMGMNWTAMDFGVPAGYMSAVGFGGTTIGTLQDFWVGAATDAQGVRNGILYDERDLPALIQPIENILAAPSPMHFVEARAVDRWLRIVGWGTMPLPLPAEANAFAVADTDTFAYILIPTTGTGTDTPEPPGAELASFPNPFNPTVSIAFSVETAGRVRVAVYDGAGRQVATLFDEMTAAARRRDITWDGRDNRGVAVASGTYFVRLTGPGTALTRKVVLVK